jgi:DNA-binding response OmpR family regulator
VLKKKGFKVIVAESPNKALNFTKNSDTNIDLLISDIIMPEMNGKDLVFRIKERFPNLKVLYMSGYTKNVYNSLNFIENDDIFIQKPFSIREFIEKIFRIFSSSSI